MVEESSPPPQAPPPSCSGCPRTLPPPCASPPSSSPAQHCPPPSPPPPHASLPSPCMTRHPAAVVARLLVPSRQCHNQTRRRRAYGWAGQCGTAWSGDRTIHKYCTRPQKRLELCKSRPYARGHHTARTYTLLPLVLLTAGETPAGTAHVRCYPPNQSPHVAAAVRLLVLLLLLLHCRPLCRFHLLCRRHAWLSCCLCGRPRRFLGCQNNPLPKPSPKHSAAFI